MSIQQTRRNFLAGASAAALASRLLSPFSAQANILPPETTSASFATAPSVCIAPQFIAKELLRADGFTDIRTPDHEPGIPATEAVASGAVDFSLDVSTAFIIPIDRGTKIKILCGLHVGCYELIAREGITSIVDLKGKKMGAGGPLSDPFLFMSAMANYVGLDARRDIEWIMSDTPALDLFLNGEIDAFISFPPEAQELRQKKVGHVIINSMVDKPWSNYFCCMLAVNPEYAERYPAATKRVVRAILKGADICVSNPEVAAQLLIDRKYFDNYDITLQALKEIRYGTWREFDPEDTLRFFGLRLHEAGIIRSGPQKLIAEGTDWRFLDEIKRELKV